MESKAKIKFTLLDAVIILIVLLTVAGIIYYLNGGGSGDNVTINYTVEFRGAKESFEGIPHIGDTVYDSVKGYYLGVVIDVYYEDTPMYPWNYEEQRYMEMGTPGEINVYLVIQANGTENADNIKVTGDNIDIRVGKKLYVKGKGYASEGYVVRMSTKKKGA